MKRKGRFLALVVLIISIQSTVVLAATYGLKTVNFNNWAPWTVYGATQVNTDFGNYKVLQGGDRLKIDTAGRLRFFLPKGSVGSSEGGGIIKTSIAAKDNYTFEYDITFDSNFPWSKGGKIPGISGGAGYTGGDPAWPGDGFSVRMMWAAGGGIKPYVYHKNQPDVYGDVFGGNFATIQSGKKYHVKYYVKLNTGSNKDGVLKIYIYDVNNSNNLVGSFVKTNICYRTNGCKIDTAHISIFPGGSDSTWNMTADGYIRIDSVKWE